MFSLRSLRWCSLVVIIFLPSHISIVHLFSRIVFNGVFCCGEKNYLALDLAFFNNYTQKFMKEFYYLFWKKTQTIWINWKRKTTTKQITIERHLKKSWTFLALSTDKLQSNKRSVEALAMFAKDLHPSCKTIASDIKDKELLIIKVSWLFL